MATSHAEGNKIANFCIDLIRYAEKHPNELVRCELEDGDYPFDLVKSPKNSVSIALGHYIGKISSPKKMRKRVEQEGDSIVVYIAYIPSMGERRKNNGREVYSG